MKYYVYISDAKVDMLLAQIPHDAKQQFATEFKVDLKIFSASRKTETGAEDNRFTRLAAVEAFIRQYGNLGTVDDPDEYIEGDLEMQWGPYDTESADDKVPPVYFGGVSERTIVGLGGSMKHVIGDSGASYAHSHSMTPLLLEYLRKPAAQVERAEVLDFEGNQRPSDPDNWALCAVELATTQMDGPKQQLEFIAKRLLYGRGYSKKKKVLLATPLYVALVE